MASRTCWNCRQYAHLAAEGDSVHSENGGFWTRAYRCDSCKALSIAKLSETSINPVVLNPVVLNDEFGLYPNIDNLFEDHEAPIEWLPATTLRRKFDDTPSRIAEAASEVFACHSIGSYRAGMLLARSVVEAIAKDKGIVDGNLKSKIDAMREKGIITPFLAQTAHEIRFIGNDMAHGDFVEEIGKEESEDARGFMTTLIEQIYQQPARLSKSAERRRQRKNSTR